MRELNFTIEGVRPENHGMTPLLEFELLVETQPLGERVKAVALHAQIQIECPKRRYSDREKARLEELFGKPERWGQTLRTRLWTHADVTIPPFQGSATVKLSVPCTFDLNIATAKYFNGLENGEVPLLFLFSGTVFYEAADGRLQVCRISWEKESSFRLPVSAWKETIGYHYPNSAWLMLDRGVFDRLCEFKREQGMNTWEETIQRLLPGEAAVRT